MTKSELRSKIEEAGHAPHFFDKETMRFFGDTMPNYGCKDAGDCWELCRIKPVKHGLQKSAYWDKETFERVYKS